MLNVTEMQKGLAMYKQSPAILLYPWQLASLAWVKSSGFEIPFDIPVVRLYDFSHPNEIREKDCPFAMDGERYYFTKPVLRDASTTRYQRTAGKQGAFWKSTSADIEIIDLNRNLIGHLKKYTLYDGNRSSNWYMDEYRVLDADGLVDPHVLCKIYDKDSSCPKYTDTSIQALTERMIERQSQTQFHGSDSHENIIRQPPSEYFPPELIPPTSC